VAGGGGGCQMLGGAMSCPGASFESEI